MRVGSSRQPHRGQGGGAGECLQVASSYLLDRAEPPLLDRELVEALRDETVGEIVRSSARLPERERRLVLGIVRQFEDEQEAGEG